MTMTIKAFVALFLFWGSANTYANADLCQSYLKLDLVRHKLSNLPIVLKDNKIYGTHGAYKASLSDGTLVLVKPHSEDWFASIPKEVGTSIFSELIGLPIIPKASFRLDPYTGLPSSVHEFMSDVRTRSLEHRIINYIKYLREKNYKSQFRLQGEILGTDVNFLINVLGYSEDEISERHVLRKYYWHADKFWKIKKTEERFLIDLGSAFLRSYFYVPTADELPSIKVPETTLIRIENLDFDDFSNQLEPYFPEYVINALFNRSKFLASLLRTLDLNDNSVDIEKFQQLLQGYYASERNDFYIPQKWKWREAKNPPNLAIDFDI